MTAAADPGVPVLLEIAEAARVIGVSTTMARRYTEAGKLRLHALTRRGVRLYLPEDADACARLLGKEPVQLEA